MSTLKYELNLHYECSSTEAKEGHRANLFIRSISISKCAFRISDPEITSRNRDISVSEMKVFFYVPMVFPYSSASILQ